MGRATVAVASRINFFGGAPRLGASCAEHVFDHHDRSIHNKAEIDGAQAHQVSGKAEKTHAGERHEH
jgi:hypothetical protein